MPYKFPSRPKASARWRYILVIPDTHVGYIVDHPTYSIPCWDITMQALAHYSDRLTDVVFLGDFGNWEGVSHWASLRADQAFLEEDIALVNARLDEVEAITAANDINVWFCEGNHEAWAGQLEAKYPQLRDSINLEHRLDFKGRNWTWAPENHFLQIGDIHFTHGHIRGARNPGAIMQKKGVSLIHGHDHTLSFTPLRQLDGMLEEWSMGCLASIDPPPPYARGEEPSRWVHSFGLVQVRANGRFQVSPRIIMDESWTELEDGTELRANTKNIKRRYNDDQKIRIELRKKYGDRFFYPDGRRIVAGQLPEPHHGKVSKNGEVSPVARTRRARIVRTIPDVVRGGSS